jgi:RNA polymerase sigma factor (sigma-70 family)
VARDERDRPDIEDEINRLLNDLPEEHRLIVILRDIEGWSETQIGEEMRLSRFAVRRRYDQAITRMKTRFGGREPN